jgi:hypothetical protein
MPRGAALRPGHAGVLPSEAPMRYAGCSSRIAPLASEEGPGGDMDTLTISAVFTLLLAALVGIALRVASPRGRFEKPTPGCVGRDESHPPSKDASGEACKPEAERYRMRSL